ncbi:hypothetical protein [Shewanella sp. MBTL60-007]|uniref:hypothetical protein n=1 Tax=Shewanella sp. MBTL60-007 TaxID=2815911 RepID=UPI001C7EE367|nr:hypothetical protein [Shewanella sp. MBTL60-007]
MCRRCRDTLQVHPWKLGHDVHVMDGHGRIYTGVEKCTTDTIECSIESSNFSQCSQGTPIPHRSCRNTQITLCSQDCRRAIMDDGSGSGGTWMSHLSR